VCVCACVCCVYAYVCVCVLRVCGEGNEGRKKIRK